MNEEGRPEREHRSAEHEGRSAGRADAPVAILIAALGGQGGGVLAEWLVDAARESGCVAQSTSIPGVAQRTGATTYYVEVYPVPASALGGRRPVLSLLPVPGCVDVFIASEMLEAARAAQAGMLAHDRTFVIASTSRTLTTAEKSGMGDGRADAAMLLAAIRADAQQFAAFDMDAAARAAGTAVSAVMFGAVAGSGRLPLPRAACEAAIRAAGVGVEASLAGFALGFAAAGGGVAGAGAPPPAAATRAAAPGVAARVDEFPPVLHPIVDAGVRRLVDFQDEAYATLYRDRMRRIVAAEAAADPAGRHEFALTRETARFLALWMAFDDIARVADLKTRGSRFARVRREVAAAPSDLVRIVDHFKPGVGEIAAMLPPVLARWLVAWDARRQRRGKGPFGVALHLRTDGIPGFVALRLLAACRGLRRQGFRYADEQTAIAHWLAAIELLATTDWECAYELALAGRLIKGYGTTFERGRANLAHIVTHLALGGDFATAQARCAALRRAREAALADDGGRPFDEALTAAGAPPRPVPAQPIVWAARRPAAYPAPAK